MEYWFLPEAAHNMCIPVSLLKKLCEQSRIKGAVRFGRVWMLPKNADRQEIEGEAEYFVYHHLVAS